MVQDDFKKINQLKVESGKLKVAPILGASPKAIIINLQNLPKIPKSPIILFRPLETLLTSFYLRMFFT
jgi:hypothetical protein